MEYDQTLNLPKTDFPMRGNLPQREPEILRHTQTDQYRPHQVAVVESASETAPKAVRSNCTPNDPALSAINSGTN